MDQRFLWLFVALARWTEEEEVAFISALNSEADLNEPKPAAHGVEDLQMSLPHAKKVLSYTKKLLALKNPFEVPFLPREEVALGHAQQEEITSAAADFKRDIDSTSGNSLAQNTEKAAGGAAAGTFKPKPDALTAALAAETGSGEKALEASQTLSASPEAGGKGGKGVLDLGGSPGLGGLSKLVGGPGAYHNLLFAPTAYEGWVIYFLYVYFAYIAVGGLFFSFAAEKFPDLLLRFVASVVCSICLLCLSFDFGLPSSLCVLLVAAGIAGGLTAGPWTVAPLLEPLPEAYRKRATQLVRQFSVGWLALLLFAAHLVVNLILTQLVDLLFGSTVTTSKAIMYVILLCAGTYPYFYLILDKLDPSQMNLQVFFQSFVLGYCVVAGTAGILDMAAVLPSPVALDPSWFFSCQFAANMGLSTGLLMVAWAAFSTSGILMAKGALSGTLRRQSTAPEELGDQQRLLLLPESQEFDDNSDHVSAYEA